MVSADNLNHDVVGAIIAFLPGNDLAPAALVSKSFYAAVIPCLYRTLPFKANHAKRYPKVMTAFGVVSSHPEFASYVRNVDIRAIPIKNSSPNPKFVMELSRAIALCKNLTSFKSTVVGVPSMLKWLAEKPELSEVLLRATNFTGDQVEKLMQVTTVKNLSLEYGSWHVVDMLPHWIGSLTQPLTSLTLYMIPDLNDTVLELVLKQLPDLQTLNVVRCLKVDHVTVLRQLGHTPKLENLTFTVTESTCPLDFPAAPLPRLHHLAIDTRFSLMPSSPSPAILAAVMAHIQLACSSLTSFAIKHPDKKNTISDVFVQKLLEWNGQSLRRLAFLDCGVSSDMLWLTCNTCSSLERLDVPVPIKEILDFTEALSCSSSLRTLVDVDSHTTHGLRRSLTQDDVHNLMRRVRNLRQIVVGQRVWTGRNVRRNRDVEVSFERIPSHGPSSYWFVSHQYQ